MDQILDEIERAADRCKTAASSLKEAFFSVVGASDPSPHIEAFFNALLAAGDPEKRVASLVQPAKEAVRAFEHVRERIVPRIDAMLQNEEDFGVRLKRASVRGATKRDELMGIRVKLLEQMSKQAKPSGHPSDLRMFAAVNSLAEVLYGCMLAVLVLPELGEDVAYIAGFLKVKHALQPKETNDTVSQNVHHYGDLITGGAKYTSTITGSNVGAVAQGNHTSANGTASSQPGSLTQDQHRAALKETQKALLDDEERLDTSAQQALEKFLRVAREIRVEDRALGDVQAAMRSVLDEVWVQQVLSDDLAVIAALKKHPAAGEVVKKLLNGASDSAGKMATKSGPAVGSHHRVSGAEVSPEAIRGEARSNGGARSRASTKSTKPTKPKSDEQRLPKSRPPRRKRGT